MLSLLDLTNYLYCRNITVLQMKFGEAMTSHTQDKAYEAFLRACSRLKSVEQFKDFFELFFTPEERKDLTNRFLIVKELLKGEKTQRVIAKDHHLSIAQITRGSNMLKILSDDAIKLINKVVLHEREGRVD